MALPGYLPNSPGNALPFGGPANSYLFYQDMAWTKKAHTIHFGGTFIQLRDNRTSSAPPKTAPNSSPRAAQTLPPALAALQAGNIYTFNVAVDPQGKLPCVYNEDGTHQRHCRLLPHPARQLPLLRAKQHLQRRRVVRPGSVESLITASPVTYGVRWEYYGVQHNHNPNLESNFFLGTGDNLAQQRGANGQIATTPNSPVGGLTKKELQKLRATRRRSP